MGASKKLRLLWFLNCHMLPRWLIELVPAFCDIGQSGPQGVARPSPPILIAGWRRSQVIACGWKTLGRLPALSAGVRKSSAEDHHDELAGRAEVVFAGPIGRPVGS